MVGGVGVMTSNLIRTIDATDLNVLIIYEAERGCYRIKTPKAASFLRIYADIFLLVANIQFHVMGAFFIPVFLIICAKHSPLPIFVFLF